MISQKNDNDNALLTMIKQKTREYWMIRIHGRNPNGVMDALSTVYLSLRSTGMMYSRESPLCCLMNYLEGNIQLVIAIL